MVATEVAAQRAGVCALCPRQQSLSSACEACLTTIKDARKVILGEQVAANQSLHPCGALGEDCVTMVHLDVPRANEVEQPPNCWRRG
jgi:hypothetical protein